MLNDWLSRLGRLGDASLVPVVSLLFYPMSSKEREETLGLETRLNWRKIIKLFRRGFISHLEQKFFFKHPTRFWNQDIFNTNLVL